MSPLDCWLTACAVFSLALGGWGIVWARLSRCAGRVAWGKRLFIVGVAAAAGAELLAIQYQASGLIFLGLSCGLLLVGMVWDTPGLCPSGDGGAEH